MNPDILGAVSKSRLSEQRRLKESVATGDRLDRWTVCFSGSMHLQQLCNVLMSGHFAARMLEYLPKSNFSPSISPGGLCLWLVLWMVVLKPGGVEACPKLCVCYPTPMTVSCQSQNLTIVPAGVPYDSQRVFLQNNRITELRADSFGFETQVIN